VDSAAAALEPQETEPEERALTEWHDMTPGERLAAWAELRAWVTWLADRYELKVEHRLPHCWALHPGLVEELRALMWWRKEIYSSAAPASGQAGRYWHSELRQTVSAATSMYAAGCRSGHRGASSLITDDTDLLEAWRIADPLTGVPAADLVAGQARRTGMLISPEQMAGALDCGDARPVPGEPDCVVIAGRRWTPASAGWIPARAQPERRPPGLPARGTGDGRGELRGADRWSR
jgi:hypothetical protein